MKWERIKRLFALLICAVMIFSIIPAQGFASETDDVTGEEIVDTAALTQPEAEPAAASANDVVKVEEVGGETTYFTSLQAAFLKHFDYTNNKEMGGTYIVTLLADCDRAEISAKTDAYFKAALDITLDLNGHTIKSSDSTKSVLNITIGSATYPATFTIKDSSGDNSGKITGGKWGIVFVGTKGTLNFNGGTITGNHGGTTGGGICASATSNQPVVNLNGGIITGNSVTGTSSANTGLGGGVFACQINVNGTVITGNYAYGGTGKYTGRGGGIAVPINGTKTYNVVNINTNTVYGNYADNAGDDLMICKNGNIYHTLSIGTENWYIDGWNGKSQSVGETARYSAENPVAYTACGFNQTKNINLGLKYVAPAAPSVPEYTVTYTDGVEDEVIFADQVYTVSEGEATPAFEGTPAREDYVFMGWNPEVAETVTEDVTYTATWEKAPRLPGHSDDQHLFQVICQGDHGEFIANSYVVTVDPQTMDISELTYTNGKWVCDVTVNVQKCVEDAVAYFKEATGAEHTVVSEVPETMTYPMYWNDAWNCWVINNFNAPADYYLTCAPQRPEQPRLPQDNGSNVTAQLITILCDTDEGHTAKTYGWGDPAANFVFPKGSEPVWDEELKAWTIGVRIESIGAYYVGLQFNKEHNGIQHDTVDDLNTIDTTLVWDVENNLWQTLTGEPFQVHVTCQTAPEAPSINYFLSRLKIKMIGNVAGAEKIWNESLHAETVTVGEVRGNRVDGFTVEVTVALDNCYLEAWLARHAAGADYDYDLSKTEQPVTFTLKYTGDTAGELYDGSEYWSVDGKTAHTVYLTEAAPEAPDKYGKNVTPDLIKVICDTDEAHAPLTIKWQHQSTKVRDWVSGVVWSEEYNTWIVPVRIDGIINYYVWLNFEKVYNNISHPLVDENQKYIDTYLKWDAEQQLWVTLDEKPIDVHVCCKTAPDAPEKLGSYQIQVKGDLDGDGIYGESKSDCALGVSELYTTTIPAGGYTLSEVYGSREEGFFVDVTVTLEDGDIYITNWIQQRAPGEDYIYNWDMTQKVVTFTLKYNNSLTGNLYGTGANDWVLETTGNGYGKVSEAFVIPAQPAAPEQKNVVADLVTIICDSDAGRHAPVTGKWHPQHCKTTSDIVWNAELNTWTVDIRIGSLYIMYVDQLEDANGGTTHELVEDITTVYSTLKWDAAQELWVSVEPIELNTTCRTAPLAPAYKQVKGYQIKVWGDVNGEEKAFTTSLPENGYTLSEVYGSREEGFFVDVTITLAEDDIYQQSWIEKRNPGFCYDYDWTKTAQTVTFTLKYNGSLTGTLYGDRHAVNTNYDWVLAENSKTFGVVCEAYLTPAKFTLTLNPDGGTVDPTTITVTFGSAIGELPVPTKVNCIFDGWYDAQGNEVTAETVYTVDGDSTITAKWIKYPGSGSSNVTNELFTIECTVKHEHSWLCNWFGSHVKLVSGSVKWNEELGRWEAQCKIGSSMLSSINSSTTKKNYFGGITHHYDETNYTFDLYYDPDFTGLNSQKKEVTGMWLPVQEYVVPVYCYTEPAAPNMAKITSSVIWMRDAANTKNYLRSKLIDGTYTVGEMYQENGGFFVKVTVNDLSAYTTAFEAKFGEGYAVGDWTKNNTLKDFVYVLKYTGSTTDYKQDGTGWSIDWPTTTEKNNGRTLWLTKQYTVTYTDGVEGKVFQDQVFTVFAMSETAKDKFAATATPAYEVPVRTGYTFAGWTPEVAATVTADATYTAVWTANNYTLTLDAAGGTVDPATLTVTFDAAIGTLPVPTRTGYTFNGWFDAEGKEVTAETVYTVAGDSTITAKWTANTYTLTLDANKGEVDPATVTVTYDAAVGTLPVPTRTGYTFNGWFDAEGKEVTAETVYTVAGDSTATAKWTANTYTLTLDANKGEVDPVTVTVTFDAAVGTLPVPTRTGYTFNGWFDAEGNEVTADTVYTIAGDSTVTAKWTPNQYTVTLLGNRGMVDAGIQTVTVTFDAPIGKLPVAWLNGYTFRCWVDRNDNVVTADTVYTTAGDMELIAWWTANKYTLTLDAAVGTVDPATLTVTYEKAIGTLPTPERTGCTFAGWVDAEGKEVTAETIYTNAADATITALWTPNSYTLTLETEDGAQIEVVFGEPIGTLPTPELEGYTFEGWYDAEGNPVTAETVYNFDTNLALSARWSANGFVIELDPGDGALNENDPETIGVTYGAAVGEMPVPVYEGYTFNGWYDENGNLVDEETVYLYTSNITVHASWEKIPEEPVAESNNGIIYVVIAGVVLGVFAVVLATRKKRTGK